MGRGEKVGKIIITNLTDLTDFSAIIRAGLYLAGEKDQATEGGFKLRVGVDRWGNTAVKITNG